MARWGREESLHRATVYLATARPRPPAYYDTAATPFDKQKGRMVPAECQNCGDTNDSLNAAVLFGVLGGMACTAVFAFICVPLVRRRAGRDGATAAADDVEKLGAGGAAPRRQSSLMSHIGRWRRAGAPSAYSAVTEEDRDDDLHRYQEKPWVGGQGGKAKARGDGAALLPLLRAVSTFTWADRRSNHTSAGSALGRRDGGGAADGRRLATDAAALLPPPRRRTRETASSRGDSTRRPGPGQLGASSASLHHTASPQQSAGISTQAPRDTQTGSKASPARRDSYPDYVRPGGVLPTTPRTTRPGNGSSLLSAPVVSLPSAAPLANPRTDMDPHNAYAGHPSRPSASMSRPRSLQLPSPPASPPQSPPLPATSSSRSHPHVHASPHARTGARPPLSSARSASSAHASTLPFRPPPPPTYTSTPAWWSTTVVHHPSTLSPPQSPPRAHSHSRPPSAVAHVSHALHPVPSPAPVSSSSQPPSPQPPPTHAPLQRSQATENAPMPGPDTAPSRGGLDRHPSLTVSPAPISGEPSGTPPRSRSVSVSADRHASVMGERPSRTPQGARPKPGLGDTLLRSGGVLSPSTPPTPATAGHDTPREQSDREKERRAHLRASMSIPQTPKLVDETASRREKGQSVALGHFDPRPAHSHSHGASPARPPPAAVRAPDLAPARPPSSSSPRRHSSAAHAAPPPPNLVRRRDSPALRPLPASTLFYPASPPTSPAARPHEPGLARAASLRRADVYGAARSRAGSVTSLATLPEFPAEGRHEGLRRRESVSSRRSMLPAMDRLPPMEFAEFEDDGR